MVTSTASAPARQRKPRAKPARSIRLLARPAHDCCGVVRITVGTDVKDYVILPVPSDFGREFRLTKILGEHEGYHVCLSDEGSLCDCKGFHSARNGECKHVAGLKALAAQGKL